MDRARPFPDAARSIVTLSNPQTPFAELATHRRKALQKAPFCLVRGCYSPRRRRKRTVAHADKPTGATHHPPGAGGRLGRTLAEGIGSGSRTFVMSSRSVNHAAIQATAIWWAFVTALTVGCARSANAQACPGSSPDTHIAGKTCRAPQDGESPPLPGSCVHGQNSGRHLWRPNAQLARTGAKTHAPCPLVKPLWLLLAADGVCRLDQLTLVAFSSSANACYGGKRRSDRATCQRSHHGQAHSGLPNGDP